MNILIFFVLALTAIYIFKEQIQKKQQKDQKDRKKIQCADTAGADSEIIDTEEIDFSHAYQAKYLLTQNEWQEFKKLREIAETKGYMICPKVRLLDIIEPIKGHRKYKTLFYKVQAKHVDFVICDQNVHIKAILELDDSTHKREDRQERDKFVDEILQSVGYRVIHAHTITEDILDTI